MKTRKKTEWMKAGAIVLLCGALFPAASWAQKKPLDLDACMTWKRVDSPDLSPSGRWITYRVVPLEAMGDEEDSRVLHVFDTRTRKEFLIPDQYGVRFCDDDRMLYYDAEDSAGVARTTLMSLPSGRKEVWPHEEPFNPVEGTPYSVSLTRVAKDTVRRTPAFGRLVVRHRKTGKAFHIDSVGYYRLYDKGRSLLFLRESPQGGGNALCYGPLSGPYATLYQSPVAGQPTSFSFDATARGGEFVVSDSLWYSFSLKDGRLRQEFDAAEIPVPAGMKASAVSVCRTNPDYVTLELRPLHEAKSVRMPEKPVPEWSFELELWTWDEPEVPTLQSRGGRRAAPRSQYVYCRSAGTLVEAAPAEATLYMPGAEGEARYALYTDETPYRPMREWLYEMPFDVYAVDLRTGERRRVGEKYRLAPKWSPTGRWALMYDPLARVWNKFDSRTGTLTDVSTAIGHPVYDEAHDKPLPASPYGLAGWSADGNSVFICDAYDWWRVDLTGHDAPHCLTRGYGRSHGKVIRKVVSNIEVDLFRPSDRVAVTVFDTETLDTGLALLSLKDGSLRLLADGPYDYSALRYSDNRRYLLWQRQNVAEDRDLWWSRADDFSDSLRVTRANPQQADYRWGTVRAVEWTNYAGRRNRGLLYLPEGYTPEEEYPVIVQFYETHTEGKNVYPAPMLSSAMGEVMYLVSRGYVVFMPDVHFTVGNPGQSCYDAVVSGTEHLIAQGIARRGRIGLQGHSWSGFQTAWLVTRTDTLFACANICAPITDMVTGYLGIRDGSGLPRYFMYEEWQSRMGKTLWENKDAYLANSPLLEADRIRTPLLILHNDRDEAVDYAQGRALYLAMRRLRRPAWLLNYKGEGHFVMDAAARRDWTLRMTQFFDHYLKGASCPRWMKEGIRLGERGIDDKYELTNP